jgi:two-component system, NtrC family, response regulator AtoC
MKDHILIVDDQVPITKFLQKSLLAEGYEISVAINGEQALHQIQESIPDLVLLDMRLPDISGFDVLKTARDMFSNICVVMMTAHGEIDDAVQAMRLGAADFITKPFNLEHLMLTIRRCLKASADSRRVYTLHRQNRELLHSPGMVISESPAMQSVYETARKLVSGDSTTVMIQGESGVGKDIVANLIHNMSTRQDHSFLEINCAAMPEKLLESELFGHERGAFTDAVSQKPGLFELANHGTIFLNEIGEMGLGLQSKLLQVLERSSFKRVGGVHDIVVDVRIISATNRHLADMVGEGSFRGDLYYRLNVVPIVVPPLRERAEDILPLADHFLQLFALQFKKGFKRFSDDAVDILLTYDWPGNIREMRNALERAVLMNDGTEMSAEQLGLKPAASEDMSGLADLLRSMTSGRIPEDFDLEVTIEKLEERLVRTAMQASDNNQSRAARLLGMHRDKLRYRLKRYEDA